MMGRVTTVAGNGEHAGAQAGVPATESPFENPVNFAFAPGGTIRLVGSHDARVLSIGSDGLVAVVAGTGEQGDDGDGGLAVAARFTELTGIAIGADRTIFVADGGAHRVRAILPSGSVEAYAGTGQSGYSGDGASALDALLQRL